MRNNNIPIHTKKDFEGMREAGSLAAEVLDSLSEKIVPGISTQEMALFIVNFISCSSDYQ